MAWSAIEEAYFQAWGNAGGPARVCRAFSMSHFLWQMLELQARQKYSGISDWEAILACGQTDVLFGCRAQALLDRLRGQAMTVESDFQQTTQRIVTLLDELHVRFHLTGGILAAYYGDPRSTQDVDIVVDLAVNRPETAELLARLAEGYEISESVVVQAIREKRLFQAIDRLSMIKIDFHVGEKIPGELSRSTRREIAPGLIAPVVSKEDAILAKLYWIGQGSYRSRRDVTEMLRRAEDIDHAGLKQRAAKLGLLDLLDELDQEMREGPGVS